LASISDAAAAHQFILQTYSYYSALMKSEPAAAEGLAGRLFWAGKLDRPGSALTVAGNIAGAATLAAASDPEAQRSAVRDGVVDFLVISLDEALRILKNEIRKREVVAVCVAAPLEAVEGEMVERGVRPDVFREQILHGVAPEANETGPSDRMSVRTLVTWRVDRAPAVWLPKIDAIALECLGAKDVLPKRWLLRSSRYLGRTGQSEHLVWSDREFAALMFEGMSAALDRREIKVSGHIEASFAGTRDSLSFAPPDEEPVAR
jgi:hypothetical protein